MTFTHDQAGTPESTWHEGGRLDRLPPLDLDGLFGGPSVMGGPPVLGERRLMVVAAHPDDETLGAGGLIAAASAAGVRIDVVIATRGEASHPNSPTTSRQVLGDRRATEVAAALAALAPSAALHMLDLPDGALSDHGDDLVAALAAHHRPGAVIAATWRGDGHPDHEALGAAAAGVATRRGVTLLEYPVWMWHWASPHRDDLPWASARRLDLTRETREVKLAAMAQHASQVAPLSPGPGDEALLSPGFLAHFERAIEVFFVTSPAGQVPTPPDRAAGASLPAEWFERFYRENGADPWGFAERWYERRKRALTLAVLPFERFSRAFEPGCSIGVLTAALGERCDEVLATDVATSAVEQARARTAHLPGVRIERAGVPGDWPDGTFDLIVLSEVGYYCDHQTLDLLCRTAAQSLTPGGILVACHWRHRVPEYPLSGDDVHRALAARPELAVLAQHLEDDFVLEVFSRGPAISVARRTGLVP